MINLAMESTPDNIEQATHQCRRELASAGIVDVAIAVDGNTEVPSAVIGILNGWTFTRAWYYWVAKTDTHPLTREAARELHAAHGKTARVDGHCGCPSPDEWWSESWNQPDHYHIDSSEGLRALAQAIKDHARPWPRAARLAEAVAIENAAAEVTGKMRECMLGHAAKLRGMAEEG